MDKEGQSCKTGGKPPLPERSPEQVALAEHVGRDRSVHVTNSAVLWQSRAVSAEMRPRVMKFTASAEESLHLCSCGHVGVLCAPSVLLPTWSLGILTVCPTGNRPLSKVWPFQIALLEHAGSEHLSHSQRGWRVTPCTGKADVLAHGGLGGGPASGQ